MNSPVAAVSELLDKWPSDREFTVESALEQLPESARTGKAVDLLIAEGFMRRMESCDTAGLSTYLDQYPDASPSLCRTLARIAELNDRAASLPGPQSWPQAGSVIGSYRLLEEIGRGAFSRVFIAADENAGHRRVVIKLTTEGHSEAELLGPLQHPNLPRILSCTVDEGTGLTVICMEFVGTHTVAAAIDELYNSNDETPSSTVVDLAAVIASGVADGLMHAHEQGILHLDIKPANILLRDDGGAVLIDFNLSAPLMASQRLGFRGTLRYAAPELLSAAKSLDLATIPVSPRSDLYSLGVVLYELLTGRVPWEDATLDEIRNTPQSRLLDDRRSPPAASSVNPCVPPQLNAIVMKALAVNPEDRFASVRDFNAALNELGRKRVPRSQPRRLTLAACVVIVMLGVSFGLLPATIRQQPAPRTAQNTLRTTAPSPDNARLPMAPRVRDYRSLPPSTLQELLTLVENLPPDPSTEIRLAAEGYLLMLLQDYRAAEQKLRRASRGSLLKDASLRCNIGYCLLQQRKTGGAAKAIDEALEVSPFDDRARFLRAVSECEQLRDPRRSVERLHVPDFLQSGVQSGTDEYSASRTAFVAARFFSLESERESPANSASRSTGSQPPLPHPRDTLAESLGVPAPPPERVRSRLDQLLGKKQLLSLSERR